MTRRIVLLASLLFVLLVFLWKIPMPHPTANPKPYIRTLPTVKLPGITDSDSILREIVVDGQIKASALLEAEKKGPPERAAYYYVTAGDFEYDHNRSDSALKYLRRAIELAPDLSVLHSTCAAMLLRIGQSSEAIAQAQEAVRLEPKSADALGILGVAYYDNGQPQNAVEALQQSVDIKPDERFQNILDKAKREASVEANFTEMTDGHFVLRYEGGKPPARQFTDEIFRVLERAYGDISRDLGAVPDGRITLSLYTKQQFFDVTKAPSWVGALNDGKLRIPLGDINTMSPQLEGVLRHELTHWFIHSMTRNCPIWLNEGIAQLEEGRTARGIDSTTKERIISGDSTSLSGLEGSFLKLDSTDAHIAYARSLAASEYLRETYGPDGLRSLLKYVSEGGGTDAALRKVANRGYVELEQEVRIYLAKQDSTGSR